MKEFDIRRIFEIGIELKFVYFDVEIIGLGDYLLFLL